MFRTVSILVLLAGAAEASLAQKTTHPKSMSGLLAKAFEVRDHREEPAAPEGTVKAPEQGFEGKDVQHVDMETAIGDWRREYGPKGPPHHPAADMRSSAFTTGALGAFCLYNK